MSNVTRSILVTVSALAVVMATSSPDALALYAWQVDDWCGTSGSDPYFYAVGPATSWNVHDGKGAGGCHMWTTTVGGSTFINWAAYYLPISSNYDGDYNVQIWIPCEDPNHFSTTDARYQRLADGTGAGVTGTMHFDQSRNLCDRFWQIGHQVHYNGSNGGYTRLVDTSSDVPAHVGVDLLLYVVPP
jgi:hypothetical protein